MGETAAETLNEIEATRIRLDGELRELEGRLPVVAAMTKRVAAVVLGIGALGATARFALRRRKRSEGDRRVRELEKRLERLERDVRDRSFT